MFMFIMKIQNSTVTKVPNLVYSLISPFLGANQY